MDELWLQIWIIRVLNKPQTHIIRSEAKRANNPDYMNYKSHAEVTMELLFVGFSNVAFMRIM